MSKSGLVLALAALAAGSPVVKRQILDFEAIVSQAPAPPVTTATVATTITMNVASLSSAASAQITSAPLTDTTSNLLPTSTTAGLEKRQAASFGCSTRQVQPTGYGYIPTVDSASAFLADPHYSSAAVNAPVPTGYVSTFTNLNAENSAYGYMGYTTLQSYSPQMCADQCDKILGCQSINILFERDPSVDPGAGCDNPPSTTVIKCVFWGTPVTVGNAVNAGQWRDNFQVVVAGSNGYATTKNIPAVTGYTGPVVLGNASIQAPLDCNGQNTYMGYINFNDGAPFDPSRCASACSAQSAYNLAHPPSDGTAPMTCQFFNTYLLSMNGNVQDQVCVMYSESWNTSFATNTGYTNNNGNNVYTISSSVTYSNTTNPGTCTPATPKCGSMPINTLFELTVTGTNTVGTLGSDDTVSFFFDNCGANSPGAAMFYMDSQCHLFVEKPTITFFGLKYQSLEAVDNYNSIDDYILSFDTQKQITSQNLVQPVCSVSSDGQNQLTCSGVGKKQDVFYKCPLYWHIAPQDGRGCQEFGLTATLVD